jgi:hypothetical protein
MLSGRPLPSQARWALVVSPPRDRPSASLWSPAVPFGVRLGGPLPRAGGVLVRAHAGGVDADHPIQAPHGVRPGLHLGQQPVQVPSRRQRTKRSQQVCQRP